MSPPLIKTRSFVRFDDILEKAVSYIKEKDILVLQKAYVFAARAHKGQVRRSGEPYLSHPLEVTSMLADMRLDRTTLIAGLLHDVMEDTEITMGEIRENFGKDVALLVEGVTKISRVQDASPEAVRAETIRKIILAMTDDIRVIFIKLADRIHNLQTLKFLGEEKQKRIARETLDIYAPIANRLGMGRIRAELENLSFRFVAQDEFFRIADLVSRQKKEAEKDLRLMLKDLKDLMETNGIAMRLFYRIKRPYSIWRKMERQDVGFDQVYDFLALRLITDSIKNCYAALGVIHQRWPHLPQRFRDFIAMPKPNLYQALHTTIITEGRKTFEIQIRTEKMHEVAENGIAAHWRYKEGALQNMVKDDKRLHWLREMVALYKEQKNPKEFLKDLKINLIPEEVYVFTPKGKVINLPPGATALDFAYKIHTEVGHHAAQARINGTSVPLKTVLATGDIVEILTSRDKLPTRNALNLVITSNARQHIKRWLNLRSKEASIALGKKLWERELRKYVVHSDLRKEAGLLKRVKDVLGTKLSTMDEFFRLAGLGKIVIDKTLVQGLVAKEKIDPRKGSFLEKLASRVYSKPGSVIPIKGQNDQMISLAKCCAPIKGEPVTGYLTRGKGITVHAMRCPLITREVLDTDRLVDVVWDKISSGPFKAKLLIKAQDTPGVLAKITGAIAALEGNITRAEVTTSGDANAQLALDLHIQDIHHLENISERISSLKEVFSVKRL